ncbi:GyrI-like domain-containing protein [Planctomicrobium sp. SH664]|uniref:GyrI-like domain-containing protein n=1 Tax=Planctomicrobium sp. SH664 TaxID=3448125 RepID=UPI003F5B477F
MKVMVIVKATKDSEAGVFPSQQLIVDMGNYNEQLVKAGIMLSGDGLQPSSAGARVYFKGPQRTVVDGPFTETKELVAGFWIWRVKSMEEAIEWALKCPNPHNEDCHIEIRPCYSGDDYAEWDETGEMVAQENRLRAEVFGLSAPRYEQAGELRIAGSNARYTAQTRVNIPSQWEKFAPHIGYVPGQVGGMTAYGVIWNGNERGEFDYLCGVEISGTEALPQEMTSVQLSPQKYVVFTHEQHISKIHDTLQAIWNDWIPDSALKVVHGPWFEKYTEAFNPETGYGGTEIWIPVES